MRPLGEIPETATPLERALTPIIRGQIRSYFNDHGKLLAPRDVELAVLGISKRIVRDLACGTSIARLAPLFVEVVSCEGGESGVVEVLAATPGVPSVELTVADGIPP